MKFELDWNIILVFLVIMLGDIHMVGPRDNEMRAKERALWREEEGGGGRERKGARYCCSEKEKRQIEGKKGKIERTKIVTQLASMADIIKALRIRSGVVRRLRKELALYSSESEREQEKVEKMRADGKDAYDIKQQVKLKKYSAWSTPYKNYKKNWKLAETCKPSLCFDYRRMLRQRAQWWFLIVSGV